MSSPTSRSMQLMRDRGYPLVQVVEKWIPAAQRRVDLYGIIDVLCVGEDVVAVQCTTAANVSSHVHKITDSEATPFLRKIGWRILVHGWYKRGSRWFVREEDLS